MAGGSLLALFDDISTLLDDVAALSKVAAHKTAGVLGDDLALNANQLNGIRAERELPVVWAVTKGSLRNKLILVPAALSLSAFAPWAVTPLLMIGGVYLCYEGVEKLAHALLHSEAEAQQEHAAITAALLNPDVDLVTFEQEKIHGAIRTDFILSAEIIVIALGTVTGHSLLMQAAVVAGIAVAMTAGVYGFVAAIVKMDDVGLYMVQRAPRNAFGRTQTLLGNGLLRAAPLLMKSLSVIGTAAMFLVGGGILLHGLPQTHEWQHHLETVAHTVPAIGGMLAASASVVLSLCSGIAAGAVALAGVALVKKMAGK